MRVIERFDESITLNRLYFYLLLLLLLLLLLFLLLLFLLLLLLLLLLFYCIVTLIFNIHSLWLSDFGNTFFWFKQPWVFLSIIFCPIYIFKVLFFICLFVFMSSPGLQASLWNVSDLFKVWVLFYTCILDFLFVCLFVLLNCEFL